MRYLTRSAHLFCRSFSEPCGSALRSHSQLRGEWKSTNSDGNANVGFSASLSQGRQKQQFKALVAGCANNSVTWLVNGIAADNASVGLITSSGLDTAPNQVLRLASMSRIGLQINTGLANHLYLLKFSCQLKYQNA